VADSNWSDTASSQRTGTHTDLGAPRPLPCEGVVRRTGAPPGGGNGLLRIELTQAAASGARYRLQDATFTLLSSSLFDSAPSALESADSTDPDVLEVAVPAGEYMLTLRDGWSLARLGDAAPTVVSAGRLSPSARSFRLTQGATLDVHLRFEVEVPGVELTAAALAPTLGILERPELSGRACLESPIFPEEYAAFSAEDLPALAGCQEIRGELYLGFDGPVDLAPLSQLTRVCGLFSLSSTAPLLGDDGLVVEQSLVGLESLEVVDGLYLSHPGVRSLAPLGRLRRIQRPDVENDVLGLFATNSALQDLSGLEQVTEIQNLRVDGHDQLRSLRGLTLPAEMQDIDVSGTQLADLSALRGLTRVSGNLRIDAGAIERLDALSNLRSAQGVSVAGAALRDATGLAGLETADYLSIQYDSPLAEWPVFGALTKIGDLALSGIGAPGRLSLPVLAQAGRITVDGDARLESLSLPALTSVDGLFVNDNPQLASLELPALSSAVTIHIVRNPLLSPPELAGVAPAKFVKIGANAGATALLTPCPWARDLECDEPGGTALCAPATDGDDCAPHPID